MLCARLEHGERNRVSRPLRPPTFPKILDLKPDLVLTFSDLQADIAATLIRHGIEVHGFNQRTVSEILDS
jgi:ABC-type Fe3+-hydroxamate transport system substrate-binding protein